jgi:hypothetical protein
VTSDMCSPNRARRNNDVFVSSFHEDARYNCKLMETLETKSISDILLVSSPMARNS